MRVKSVDVPTSPTSLSNLLNKDMRHTSLIGLQAPSANVEAVFFGDRNEQPFELRPKANASLPITSFKEVFIKGASGDKLSIVLFDGQ